MLLGVLAAAAHGAESQLQRARGAAIGAAA